MKVVEIPPSEDLLLGTEDHPEGQHIIRIEFYKTPDGSYFVWPMTMRVRRDCARSKHFQVLGHFPDMGAARQAAINQGRAFISPGFDISQTE
jgi:hypothetical protein